jgi:hypothetical protein
MPSRFVTSRCDRGYNHRSIARARHVAYARDANFDVLKLESIDH